MCRIVQFLVAFLATTSLAHAALVIDITESGGEVVATFSGSANTSGLAPSGGGSTTQSLIYGSGRNVVWDGAIIFGPPSSPISAYQINTPVVFSTGTTFLASTATGDAGGIILANTAGADRLYLPSSYVSGSPVSSNSTWSGTTIAGLGLIPGTYNIVWSSDSLTLNIGGSSGTTFSVGGPISGLSGSVTLQNNGGDDLTLNGSGTYAFPTTLVDGASYSVAVSVQPSGQTCTVTNGIGTISGANVTNVAVNCISDPVPTYSVGGTLSGLDCGGLTGCLWLENNGSFDEVFLSNDGPFTFPTELADGSGYSVTVAGKPAEQTCTVSNGSGTISGANVTDVAVTCQDNEPPEPPEPSTAIPTLSQWAMITLVILLGLVGAFRLRQLI
jgi:hypothetical protein